MSTKELYFVERGRAAKEAGANPDSLHWRNREWYVGFLPLKLWAIVHEKVLSGTKDQLLLLN